MAYSTMDVSNTFLQLAFREGIALTPFKLQRLLYLAAAEQLTREGKELFQEPFQVWPYGAVLSSVYHKFLPYNGRAIERYATDAKGSSYVLAPSDPLSSLLREIWRATHVLPDAHLARLVRSDTSPWAQAYEKGQRYITPSELKSEESLRRLLFAAS